MPSAMEKVMQLPEHTNGTPRPAQARYAVILTDDPAMIARAQALRAAVFRGPRAPPDRDAFDTACQHVLVEEVETGLIVACARALPLAQGRAAAQDSYSAQFYGLESLARLPGAMLEIGRFCAAPGHRDPAVLRLIWAGLTAVADRAGAGVLFGCASFPGADPARHGAALGVLAGRHLLPPELAPTRRAVETLDLAQAAEPLPPRDALLAVPTLLRGYLALGARVSDHAVIDRDMNTLHVLTLLQVAAIAPARLRLLRAEAARAAPRFARGVPA